MVEAHTRDTPTRPNIITSSPARLASLLPIIDVEKERREIRRRRRRVAYNIIIYDPESIHKRTEEEKKIEKERS